MSSDTFRVMAQVSLQSSGKVDVLSLEPIDKTPLFKTFDIDYSKDFTSFTDREIIEIINGRYHLLNSYTFVNDTQNTTISFIQNKWILQFTYNKQLYIISSSSLKKYMDFKDLIYLFQSPTIISITNGKPSTSLLTSNLNDFTITK